MDTWRVRPDRAVSGHWRTADLLNAGLYALEGDWANAAISGVGVVPILGDAAKAGRWVKRAREAAQVALYDRAGSKALRALRPSEEVVCETSRAARREGMRRAGIPTCQQPLFQSKKHGEYRWYVYEKHGSPPVVVQHYPADALHSLPHWEVGVIKKGQAIDPYAVRSPKYGGGRNKIKVPYKR